MEGKSEEDLVSLLQRSFRLTAYEAKIYLALLKGASSPKEASAMSGVPLPRVYDVIRVLESKGLAVPSSEGWYRYVPPRAAAVAEIARIEEESRSRALKVLEAAELLEREIASRERVTEPLYLDSPYQAISLAVDALRDSGFVYITVLNVLHRYESIVETVASEAVKLGKEALILISNTAGADLKISVEGVELVRLELPLPDSLVTSGRAIFLFPGGTSGVKGVAVSDENYVKLLVDTIRKAVKKYRAS
ncbi:putative transcriptional regulator, TrmB family [Aeropyrum pernix K1]|uniref:Transcriptional regulator, TrmB family n=1 Tax=Aeropyrum pernix (strain ATCC 700893 / DSM 11879 / JCM 9820 / NBRC 100138 / K1) TaxID=272557 RepID=Q9YFU7_AERPE|nr:TrmB family transcriptional regulator [Aeropyrum pernix]BAA79064.2 putative transcriptional regulator, TrmB family [Aeropyrum pernix K1]